MAIQLHPVVPQGEGRHSGCASHLLLGRDAGESDINLFKNCRGFNTVGHYFLAGDSAVSRG